MLSKPFKPLKIRQPASHDGTPAPEGPPTKRQRLSPPLASQLSASKAETAPLALSKRSELTTIRKPLKPIANPPSPEQKYEVTADSGIESYYSILWYAYRS
jgi:hypothetical protein